MKIKKITFFTAFFIIFSLLSPGLYAEDEDKINLNSATVEELAKVPGINKELAKRIIEAREDNGEFVDMEELLDIEEIDEKLLDQLKKYIKIEELDDCNC
ncbi:helix-hairpin-helix domain-containing protein [Thermodesulfobacteriota bacterium]